MKSDCGKRDDLLGKNEGDGCANNLLEYEYQTFLCKRNNGRVEMDMIDFCNAFLYVLGICIQLT